MSSPIRSQITSELDRAVRQASVVVWQDEHREYTAAARSIAPPGVPFIAYDGSWYGLRWEVEHLLASEKPPQLIVYASAPAPADDPQPKSEHSGSSSSTAYLTWYVSR